jgi:hypothetical protein
MAQTFLNRSYLVPQPSSSGQSGADLPLGSGLAPATSLPLVTFDLAAASG